MQQRKQVNTAAKMVWEGLLQKQTMNVVLTLVSERIKYSWFSPGLWLSVWYKTLFFICFCLQILSINPIFNPRIVYVIRKKINQDCIIFIKHRVWRITYENFLNDRICLYRIAIISDVDYIHSNIFILLIFILYIYISH